MDEWMARTAVFAKKMNMKQYDWAVTEYESMFLDYGDRLHEL